MKCKPYSEITVEIRTQLKTVKITSNIFAVYSNRILKKYCSVHVSTFEYLPRSTLITNQLLFFQFPKGQTYTLQMLTDKRQTN